MYLSKLELHGFKSFATPTVLHFDPGLTAIVGPNGCGKSNIVDAVRWVIGEQRARILRSEKMENVIFNGTARRRPLGLAEVLLTIENTRGVLPTEYSEVTLGRRLYRSGESEYLLNGTPCRLRDIIDLFMDTGMGAGAYSVIELKMIEEILSDNANDRRHLFEEAAGITKYKQRRTQTLRKLDSTQADLTRLRDLTDEIDKRVQSLKRQAAKATRYKEYEGERQRLELSLAQIEHDRLTAQEEALQAEMQSLHDDLDAYTARLAKDDAEREALRTALVEREQTLGRHQQAFNEHLTAVRDLEADLRLARERLDNAHREHERTAHDLEDAEQQRADLARYAEQLADEVRAATPQRDAAEEALRTAEAERDRARAAAETRREALQALRRREHETSEARTDHLRQLDRVTNRIDLLTREHAGVREDLETIDAALRDAAEEAARARRAYIAAADTVDAAERARAEVEAAHDDARSRLEEALETRRGLERRLDAVTAEVHLLEGLMASFDEFPDAVQFLASSPAWTPAALQTVADLLACDDAHRAALDAALGDLGACLVVRDDREARQAVALLRAEQKGRATFLILDRLPQAPSNGAVPAGAVPLADLTRVADPDLEHLARLLLHGYYFVDSLDQAETLAGQANGSTRYVASSGEWLDGRGLVHGGSAQAEPSPTAGRLGRREQLERARADRARLQDALDQAAATVTTLQQALDALPLADRRTAVDDARRAHADAERAHTRTTVEQEAVARRHAEHAERLTRLETDAAAERAAVGPLREAATAAERRLETLRVEREAAEEAFQVTEAAGRAAQDRFNEASVAAVQARNRYDNLLREQERTRQQRDTLARQAENRRAHLESLRQTIDATETRQAELQDRLDAVRSRRSELEDAVSKAKTALLHLKADIDAIEVRLRKLRQGREDRMREENVRAVRQAEIQTRREDLLAGILETFGVSLADARVTLPDDFDEAAAREAVHDLRQKIKNLGNVNALALEEYETERERLDFLTAQQEDLEQAEATLLETIDEINTTAAARFEETYAAIRASFQRLFSELFGQDAAADLVLADPDDLLESAIDVIARPRGKRPIHIAQLSSGEKTLTAIALLFAIYLVKPSPFCILDEVDAPLDDANIDRFMHLIRQFSQDTQFILVTHNKRTMELADRLYGITMQEQGVSRLVGVRFEEALAIAG